MVDTPCRLPSLAVGAVIVSSIVAAFAHAASDGPGSIGFGRHLVEEVCGECHRVSQPPMAKPPPMQVFADAVDAAAKQEFLLRRLVTAAADIVDDAGADFDAAQCALAVHDAVYRSISDVAGRIDTRVIHAIPDDEWDALIEARRACHAHYREMENGPPIRVVVEAP